jgi:hypothetical protein
MEVTPDHDARVQRIFDNGNATHERLSGYFKKMGILLDEEFKVSHDDPPITGIADGLIEWNGPQVVEYKSINEAGFIYRRLYHKPKDDHYKQIQLYMHCLNLDSGFVIYENKNDQQILPLYVERNLVYIEKLFKKYRKSYGAFLEGKLPVRPYKAITSKQCSWCDIKDFCWADPEIGDKI